MQRGFVYILSNKNHTTLYVGVTNDIRRRTCQHKTGHGGVFSGKYIVSHLLYYEQLEDIYQARLREKQLKRWHRDWKWNLIKELNPELVDLAADWFSDEDIEECARVMRLKGWGTAKR